MRIIREKSFIDTKQDEFIDFIKHQLNFDIKPYITGSFKRKFITIDWKEIDDLIKREIIRLSFRYKLYNLEPNGTTVSVEFPIDKTFDTVTNYVKV